MTIALLPPERLRNKRGTQRLNRSIEREPPALRVLDRLVTSATGVVSTQVLAEFFVTVTNERKFPGALSVLQAMNRVQNYIQSWEVVEVTGMIVLEAIRGVRDYQFNFWDAQIWATAKLNQIPVVYSEDFNVGGVIEGVHFVNLIQASEESNN